MVKTLYPPRPGFNAEQQTRQIKAKYLRLQIKSNEQLEAVRKELQAKIARGKAAVADAESNAAAAANLCEGLRAPPLVPRRGAARGRPGAAFIADAAETTTPTRGQKVPAGSVMKNFRFNLFGGPQGTSKA